MQLEETLAVMPSYICDGKGNHYHLFIAKGTRGNDDYVVGYSNHEKELSEVIVNADLNKALQILLLKMAVFIND